MISQIFLHILIVPIMYECGKLKKVIGDKFLFPVILEQCENLGTFFSVALTSNEGSYPMKIEKLMIVKVVQL